MQIYLFQDTQIHRSLQINNHEERGYPTYDTELDEMILDKRLRRATTQTEDDHILQVSK